MVEAAEARTSDVKSTEIIFIDESAPVWPWRVAALAKFSLGHPELVRRVQRFAWATTLLPCGALSPIAPEFAARTLWQICRGLTQDRLRVLGRELAENAIIPEIKPEILEHISDLEQRGAQPLLATSLIAEVAQPVANYLGAKLVLCNRLEMRAGRATGVLLAPIITKSSASQLASTHAVATT